MAGDDVNDVKNTRHVGNRLGTLNILSISNPYATSTMRDTENGQLNSDRSKS